MSLVEHIVGHVKDAHAMGRIAPPVLRTVLAALTCLGAIAGCGAKSDAPGTQAGGADTASTATAALEPFDAARFANSTVIDNAWLPLKPGMRYTYEGTTIDDEGKPVPHRIVINVTDLTKMVGGVRSVVTWDLDYSDGELQEAELAFLAQDEEGNVWRMGEYPEEYDGTKMIANPAWIHGIEDARAGIMMKAQPALGTPDYSQGWGPKVGWTDRGRVDSTGIRNCVPVDCYDDVLVIAETSQSEPGAEQLKYYARGVGNVRVGWRGAGEKTKETLELVKVETLDAKALAEVRASALKLEKSAYDNSKTVYGQTSPAEPASGGGS